MDSALQAKIDEAKANGYSDEEINAYITNQTNPAPQQGLGAPDRSQENLGLAQGIGLDTAGKILEYGIPAAGAAYGAKKLFENFRGPVNPAQAAQAAQAGGQALPAAQQAMNGPINPGAPKRPNLRIATPSNAGAQAFEQMGQQLTKPVGAPEVPPQSNMFKQGLDYANKMREIAAQRVLQNAGNIIKGGVGLGAMTYSAPLGPAVPNQGPYRGMEINPMTNRPWTPQELAQLKR